MPITLSTQPSADLEVQLNHCDGEYSNYWNTLLRNLKLLPYSNLNSTSNIAISQHIPLTRFTFLLTISFENIFCFNYIRSNVLLPWWWHESWQIQPLPRELRSCQQEELLVHQPEPRVCDAVFCASFWGLRHTFGWCIRVYALDGKKRLFLFYITTLRLDIPHSYMICT